MYPAPSNLRAPLWGDAWLITGTPGNARLVETVGFAVLVQVQTMLAAGTLPTDRVPSSSTPGDSGPLGPPSLPDANWGSRTVRALGVYLSLLRLGGHYPVPDRAFAELSNARRGQPIGPHATHAAICALYFAPRLVRTGGGVEVLPPRLWAQSPNEVLFYVDPRVRGLPVYGERLPYPIGAAGLDGLPTWRDFNADVPVSLIPRVERLRDASKGGPVARTSGPWTLAPGVAAPVQLGSAAATPVVADVPAPVAPDPPPPAPPASLPRSSGVRVAGMDLGPALLATSAALVVGGAWVAATAPGTLTRAVSRRLASARVGSQT